ncbi:hypothetical protein A3715_17065 [Oleiphilus sp. HI0009]|nr:hypothetical protein A3715_17065 [Oleiphilus sp. HI0009]
MKIDKDHPNYCPNCEHIMNPRIVLDRFNNPTHTLCNGCGKIINNFVKDNPESIKEGLMIIGVSFILGIALLIFFSEELGYRF